MSNSNPVQSVTRHSKDGWYRYRHYAVCHDGTRREFLSEVFASSEYEALQLVNGWNKQNLTDPYQYHYFLTNEYTPMSDRDRASAPYSGKVRELKLTGE
jgi:hypothetical protein